VRFAEVMPKARTLPAFINFSDIAGCLNKPALALEQIGQCRRAALVGHMHDVDPGHRLEQLQRQCGEPRHRRGDADLAGFALA